MWKNLVLGGGKPLCSGQSSDEWTNVQTPSLQTGDNGNRSNWSLLLRKFLRYLMTQPYRRVNEP
jgi:hypothetical protein